MGRRQAIAAGSSLIDAECRRPAISPFGPSQWERLRRDRPLGGMQRRLSYLNSRTLEPGLNRSRRSMSLLFAESKIAPCS